jgi:hypothetical protein
LACFAPIRVVAPRPGRDRLDTPPLPLPSRRKDARLYLREQRASALEFRGKRMPLTGSGVPRRALSGARVVLGVVVLFAVASCDGSSPGPGDGAEGETGAGAVVTLPVQPGARSAQLLTRLEASETGVTHQNVLPMERTGNYLHVGGGAAAGDYDGDGLVDVFLVSQAGPSSLYRNLGGWRFENVTDAAGIAIDRKAHTGRWDERFPTGAQFVDADGDGDLDLFVTAFAGAATYFENRGGGKFQDATEESGLGYVGASTTPAFGDNDRDGDLDLYLAT